MNPFIYVQNQNLTPEFCNHCIDKFERDDRKHVGLAGEPNMEEGYRPNVKQSMDLNITHFDDWKDEDNIFYEKLYDAYYVYNDYLKKLIPENQNDVIFVKNNEVGDTGYQIQRTKPSEFYTWHNDFIVLKNKVRIITFIWYLNTIHEDGYTEFWDGTKIQPEQGKLMLFPATWDFIHRGYPPKSETKYICTGWIHYENQE